MSSVPLVALTAKQPEAPDILGSVAKAQQIRGMLLGQQLTQANLQAQQMSNEQVRQSFDTQKQIVAASHDKDWNPTDPDAALKTLSRYGVPLSAQATVMKGIGELRSQLSAASKDQLESSGAFHSFLDDQLQGAKNAPEGTREKTYQQVLQNAAQYVQNLPPGPARQQMMQEISAAPPIYDQNFIDREHGLLKTAAALTKDALEKAQTAEAAGRGAQSQAEAGLASAKTPGAQAESSIQQQQSGLTPQGRALAGNLFYAGGGGDPQALKAIQLETQQKMAAAQAGIAGAPEALRGVTPKLVLPATADATKADQAFSAAKQAGDEVLNMVQLAKSGNKIAYAYSPVTGVLQIKFPGQIKRMNMPEIESYGGAGSAADRIKGFLGKQTSGASIPTNILNDMASVSQMVTDGANKKYERDLAGINSRYGSRFMPNSGEASASGATTRIRASDGSMHDIPSANLDKARKIDPGLKVIQ